MSLALLLLGLMVARCALGSDLCASQDGLAYTSASIVNAADNKSTKLAPNTIASIYGSNLAYSTTGITAGDFGGGSLPIMLGDGETTVYVSHEPVGLYYVSPGQINFLVPPALTPGPVPVYVDVAGCLGPIIQLTLAPAAPGLFSMVVKGASYAVATLLDGSLLMPSPPSSAARPGDIVVLWAGGLGATMPLADGFQLPTAAAPLVAGANLQVLLNGVAVPSSAIEYAGVAPGFAGLYQINLILPKSTAANPEIRLQLEGAISIPKVYLPVVLN
jgi:uncharacterized protein (TIGR03437 family)